MRKAFSALIAAIFLFSQIHPAFSQPSAAPTEIAKTSSLTDLAVRLHDILDARASDITSLTKTDEKTLTKLLERLKTLSEAKKLTPAEATELQAILQKFKVPLEKLEQTYAADLRGLVSGNQISPDIARQLESKCGPIYRDIISAFGDADLARSNGRALTGRIAECYKLYELMSAQLDATVKQSREALVRLEAERSQLEREFASATPEQRPEIKKKLDANEAKIKEERQKINKTREVKGKVDWGKILLGAAICAAGVVAAAFGEPDLAIALMSAGGTMIEAGGNPKPGQEHYTEDGPATRTRVGVTEGVDPGSQATAELVKEFADSGMKNISSGERDGNFIVFQDPSTSGWTIMQIKERLLIANITVDSIKEVRDAARRVNSLADLKNPVATEVRDPSTAVKIRLSAEAPDGAKITGGLTETAAGTKEFILTVD